MEKDKAKKKLIKYAVMGAVSAGIAYLFYNAPSKISDKILTFTTNTKNKGMIYDEETA